jgi:hypothetical protein
LGDSAGPELPSTTHKGRREDIVPIVTCYRLDDHDILSVIPSDNYPLEGRYQPLNDHLDSCEVQHESIKTYLNPRIIYSHPLFFWASSAQLTVYSVSDSLGSPADELDDDDKPLPVAEFES